MPVVISMLRGVNLGGHHRIKMHALRALYESLGLLNPQTYVQSGNVVFKTKERNLLRLARTIEDGIERSFGFRPAVILRTSSELRDVIARNPFAKRRGIEPAKLLVTFFATDLIPETRDQLLNIKPALEEIQVHGRELYIHYPNGMGQSKLPPILERALKKTGTARNWNSVTNLLALADKMEARASSPVPARNRTRLQMP